jgi:hypothetical protein
LEEKQEEYQKSEPIKKRKAEEKEITQKLKKPRTSEAITRAESSTQMVWAESSTIKEEQDECSANQAKETFTPSPC